MSDARNRSDAAYRVIRALAIAAWNQGRTADAIDWFAKGVDEGRRRSRQLGEIAFCNWAGATIAAGQGGNLLPPLAEILVGSSDVLSRRLAAYNISVICQQRGELDKALFYARLAHELAMRLDPFRPSSVVASHNLIGNLLTGDSRFGEALDHYTSAAEAAAANVHFSAVAKQNVAYSHLMLGRPSLALPLLECSLRTFYRRGLANYIPVNHLDLAQTYLELGCSDPAIRHAERALGLAHQRELQSDVKNALFLLGEAWHLHGDDGKARLYFEQLGSYYDDLPFLADLLLSVDVRGMLNLGA